MVPVGEPPEERSSSGSAQTSGSIYARFGKRLFDLTLGSALAILTLPLQLVVGIFVRKKLGTPVLFRQERPGLNGEPFEMIKFRTMTDERDPSGELLSDAQRLTPFGKTLRSTSLDELPEIYNVIKGDMSLVGPRPLLMRYLARYTPRQYRRNEVKPGITGLAQVNGRNNQSWESKFELDVEYVDRMSFALDLQILAKTVLGVLRRSGVSAEGHATAPEFGLEDGVAN